MKTTPLFVAAGLAAPALTASLAPADETVWMNVRNFPADIINTQDGWSAVRSEPPNWVSHRCTADDFELARDTRLTRIVYWSVHINDPVNIIGGDWYIYADDARGVPGTLLHQGGGSPLGHELAGFNHSQWGPIYVNTIDLNVDLPAGRYWLGLRTLQALGDPNVVGKRNNIMFTTRGGHGAYPAHWSFGVQGDGVVTDPWVSMQVFNLVAQQEWAFQIDGAVACYPDCDTSTGAGVLDIFDFLCFQNRYDIGAAYACDCDTSTGQGVCDIFDFLCFQNAYDAGCP